MGIRSASTMLSVSLICLLGMDLAQAETLQGSEWAKQHPKVLPYDSCMVMQKEPDFTEDEVKAIEGKCRTKRNTAFFKEGMKSLFSKEMSGYGGEVCVGAHKMPTHTYLACSSSLLGIAYMLPIEFGRQKKAGLSFSPFSIQKYGILFQDLDRKSVSDLIGDYKGVSAGFSFGVGASMASVKNDSGVQIRILKSSLGFPGFEIGGTWFTMGVPLEVPMREVFENNVVVGRTDVELNYSDYKNATVPVHLKSLSEMRFVFITPENVEQYRLH